MQIPFFSLYEKVQLILTNKIEEFHYYGYDSITEQDLWKYCIDKVWRKRDVQNMRLHELTAGIFRATASEVLSYMQIKDFKRNELNLKLSNEELQGLFHVLKE
ncbi:MULTISPECIES: post-transcriptional regulator [Solibacillus]|uniref:post-transcriptional regulator n=1 Tax=Solibacillus TaxID=648800 RepID=UPI00203FE6FF|nr:post-transcriptional regulator [Solibacillus isronensis]MCM3720708.1 post-transcriptional regulator [Solibacillus isronensis]